MRAYVTTLRSVSPCPAKPRPPEAFFHVSGSQLDKIVADEVVLTTKDGITCHVVQVEATSPPEEAEPQDENMDVFCLLMFFWYIKRFL